MYQIRYMLAAARTLNFTRAAEACSVSQPALTKAIKALEAELGAALFNRDGRRLTLTDFAGSILPHFEQILNEADLTQTLAKNHRLLRKVPLRIGVLSTVGPVRLSRFLSRFQAEHRGVEVSVTEASVAGLARQLEEGRIDFAILNPLEGLVERAHLLTLYDERYVVILPPDHPLGRANAVTLKDLSGQNYVDRLSCEMRDMVMQVCQDNGIELYARFRSEREDWVQAMVLARIGFAFMPEFSVTLPDLVQRPLVEPEVTRQIALAHLAGRPFSPAANAFVRAAQGFAWPG